MASKTSVEPRSWAETPPISPPIRTITGEFIASQNWLETLADPIQNWVKNFYGTPGKSALSGLKSFLNGVWLGHPVHPALTDVPIGAWTTTFMLDTIWLASENPDLANASDISLLLGLFGAGAAAVAGITDWSDTDGIDRRVGLLHGLLNVGVTATNLASYFLRRAGMRRTGIALSGVGYLVAVFSASLVGELSYAMCIGLNHV